MKEFQQKTSRMARTEQSRPDSPLHADNLTRAHVEQSYRRYAPIYDFLFGASLRPGRIAMTNLVSALAPDNILEVGVGTGLTLSHYPKHSNICGIDVSSEMLAEARRRINQQDLGRIALSTMDAEAMDFPDAYFDCVTIPYVLSVTPNPELLIQQVRRVCRPGGHIIIVNHFSGQFGWRGIERVLNPLSKWLGFRTKFSLEQNVLKYDWEVLSIAPTNLLSLSRIVHLRNV